MFKVMGINKTIAEQRNAGNLFVQDYTGIRYTQKKKEKSFG